MATTENPNLSDHDRRLLDGLFDEVEAERSAAFNPDEEPEPEEAETMTDAEFCELLSETLWLAEAEGDLPLGNVESFAERMLLTNNAGLVVRLSSGEEFQVQVVRSN